MKLRDYQELATSNVAKKLASGKRKIVFQLATGGGKTIIFSAISKRYTEKNNKSVLYTSES
jgi:superfamily II DNA or RNA helicase